jgi:hypothetical protein
MHRPEDHMVEQEQSSQHGRYSTADHRPQPYQPETYRAHVTDAPDEGPASRAALQERLDRLPRGHPSSPFHVDGSRKPPPPDLTKSELPLPDELDALGGQADATTETEEPAERSLTAGGADHTTDADRNATWEWKGRQLSPEQSRAGDDALATCRGAEGRDIDGKYGEHGLTPAMRRIEATLEHGRLVDRTEEFALKSPDRFKEKLAKLISDEPGSDLHEIISRINDGVRYTFHYLDQYYASGVTEVRDSLTNAGFELYELKNAWADESKTYKGVNSTWRDISSGVLFEVQVHTAASWEAKQQSHELYEVIESRSSTPQEKMRARGEQDQIFARVPVPAGAGEIPSYRKEGW